MEWVNESWNYFWLFNDYPQRPPSPHLDFLKAELDLLSSGHPWLPTSLIHAEYATALQIGYILIPSTGPVALCNHTDFLVNVRKDFLKKKMNLSLFYSICSYID